MCEYTKKGLFTSPTTDWNPCGGLMSSLSSLFLVMYALPAATLATNMHLSVVPSVAVWTHVEADGNERAPSFLAVY